MTSSQQSSFNYHQQRKKTKLKWVDHYIKHRLLIERLEVRELLAAIPVTSHFSMDSEVSMDSEATAAPSVIDGSSLPISRLVSPANGTWQALTKSPPTAVDTMLLMTDGTVMAHDGGTKTFYKLTPDSTGNYHSGTWSNLAPMSLERLYYGSNVLPSGKVFVLGGEYSGPALTNNWINSGEIYDPVANTWAAIPNFPQTQFGDDPTVLLPNGKVLAGYLSGTQTYLYNPSSNTWAATGSKLHGDRSDEETWVLLPDGSVLTVDVFSNNHAQRYIPATETWVDAGNVPVILTGSAFGFEMGPAMLLPDGRVIQVGANNKTAIYTPSTNTWVAGPSLPVGLGADDSPGAMLPNGHFIFAVDKTSPLFTAPTKIYEFDPTANTLTDITPSALSSALNIPAYTTRMLVLPNGHVLLTTSNSTVWEYTPGGTPDAAWAPTVSSVEYNGLTTYTLTGTQLTGISEGSSYGDDAENSTNYPIVKLTNSSGIVKYARSFNWTPGVATGTASVTTQFSLPTGFGPGNYTLNVIANGIASADFPFVVNAPGNVVSNIGSLARETTGNKLMKFSVDTDPLTGTRSPLPESNFQFGLSRDSLGSSGADDTAIVGDWGFLGFDQVGVTRSNIGLGATQFLLDTDRDPDAEYAFRFGLPGDVPVAGNFDGLYADDVGVTRSELVSSTLRKHWYLSYAQSNPQESFPRPDPRNDPQFDTTVGVSANFIFGLGSDLPRAGDFNGDGLADIAAVSYNGAQFIWQVHFAQAGIAYPNDGSTLPVNATYAITSPTGMPIVGDWDGNGIDNLGSVSEVDATNQLWSLDTNFGGSADISFNYARGDQVVAGRWPDRLWDGGGGDLKWSTAANWTEDILPGVNSKIGIDQPGTPTIDVANVENVGAIYSNETINVSAALLVNQPSNMATITINGGQFVPRASLNANSFTMNSGFLTLETSPTIGNIKLNLNGGMVDVPTGNDRTLTHPLIIANSVSFGGAGILRLSGAIGGSGSLVKTGGNYMQLLTAETYVGSTTVSQGELLLGGSNLLPDSTAVNIANGALLNLAGNSETVGTLAGAGTIGLGTGSAVLTSTANSDTTFSGSLTGSGTLVKQGTGALTVTGNPNFVGSSFLNAGTLIVNGALLSANPLSVAFGAILKGTGTVGATTVAGSIAPGTSPGVLRTGNLNLTAGATMLAEIGGANPGNTITSYDQVIVTGTVNIATGALLNITSFGGFVPSILQTYILISNDGSDPISGTFSGFPEGTTLPNFLNSNKTARITYVGGDGNDVAVIVDVNQAPTAITLSNSTTSLPENSNSITHIKLADVSVIDDGLGSNSLTLAGLDAQYFEIIGSVLYLKAGTALNYEAKSSYALVINADDATVGSNPDTTLAFTLNVLDVNEPTVLGVDASQISGNVLTTLTNSGTWNDPELNNVALSTSLGTVVKNANGTWSWSYAPPAKLTNQVVTITANDGLNTSNTSFTISTEVNIQNRQAFYKGSAFSAGGSNVAAALDPSKVLAQSSTAQQTLSYANLLNTTFGINGVVFDIAGLVSSTLTTADISFRMSPTGLFNEAANPPSSWGTAPTPTTMDVTAGTATTAARVRIEWTDNLIANRWLQIRVSANTNTGLQSSAVYYIGHLQGELDGNLIGGSYFVNNADLALVNPIGGGPALVTEKRDVDKNRFVLNSDGIAIRDAVVGGFKLRNITIPAAGSANEGLGGPIVSQLGGASKKPAPLAFGQLPVRPELGISTVERNITLPKLSDSVTLPSNAISSELLNPSAGLTNRNSLATDEFFGELSLESLGRELQSKVGSTLIQLECTI